MSNDTAIAADPVATEETTVNEPAPLSTEDLVVLMTSQNLALVESVKALTAALRKGRIAKSVEGPLADAEKAANLAFNKLGSFPDLTPMVRVVGAGAGWKVLRAVNEAFEKVLKEDLAAALPTVASITADDETENGDEGQTYFSFSGMDITFKDGQKIRLSRDFDADIDEFTVSEDEELIRWACDGRADEDQLQSLDGVVAKYATLFGVEPSAENVKECLDTLGNYVGSYYNHNPREGGLDLVYSA